MSQILFDSLSAALRPHHTSHTKYPSYPHHTSYPTQPSYPHHTSYPGYPSSPHEPSDSWQCSVVWDGTDFSRCFKKRYLDNWSVLLTAISALCLVLYKLISLYHRKTRSTAPLDPSQLVSPTSDSDFANLESQVIISSLASSLLPPHAEDGTSEPLLPEKEAERVIEDFKEDPQNYKRWEAIRWWVRVIGGVIWLGLELLRASGSKQWKHLIYPCFNLILALYPQSPLTPILTLNLPVALLHLRSDLIHYKSSGATVAALVFQAVYWATLISIPYSEEMNNMLKGAKSKGGSSMGSFGADLPKHLEEPVSAFGRAAYTFMLPLLFKHYKDLITLEQVPAIREDDGAAASLGAFRADQAKRDTEYANKHGGEKRKRNLPNDLLKHFGPDIAVQCGWACIFIMLQYLPPLGLQLLLKFINERGTSSDRPNHVAWLYVAMMAAGQCLGVVAMGQSLYLGRRRCIRLRALIISEVFAKALRRQDSAGDVKKSKVDEDGNVVEQAQEGSASEGKIANLVSVDAFQVSEICAYIYYLVSCPLAVVINSVLLYNTLGVAAFAGMAVLLAMLPVQTAIGKLYAMYQKRFMAAVDSRLETVTEVIAHIKLIKFNAWESKFFDRLLTTRTKELHHLAQRFMVIVISNLVIWGTPVLVTASAFAVHSLALKQPLTADRAFSSLILFNMLRDPFGLFQDTLLRLLQAYTSCQRIQQYLEEPETEKYRQVSEPGPNDPKIGFTNAVVGYTSRDSADDQSEPFRLGPMDLSFPVGALSIIVGPVGSGKTTLIMSLLGETRLHQGKVFMPNDHANRDICPIDPATGLSDAVAYCAQTPWLVGATIKQNIIFGSPVNESRYQRVLDACALRRDLEIFELGDATEVGEKGTTCSGGQKARIALARALYSPAKTIILDDVLSAVDAQTARHIYVHCLQGPLMKGRSCLLVTHAVNLVAPGASFAVMLDAGSIVGSGSPAELVAAGKLDLVDEAPEQDQDTDSNGGSSGRKASSPDEDTPGSSTLASDSPHDIIEDNLDGVEADALETAKKVDADKAVPEVVKLDKSLVQAEGQNSGVVGLATYGLYFRSQGGLIYWIILIATCAGSQGLQVSTNTWIKDWANSNDRAASIRTFMFQERSTQYYLGVYCLIAGVYLIAVAARVGINFVGSIHASRLLYRKLLKRILGAKMRFFDSTPSGRIMNRLSKDVSLIDTEAAEILQYFAQCVLSVIAVLAVVIFSTPKFIFALIVISVLYWTVGILYVTTSRELKRFDSTTRSPIFISFSEALVGMSTIRSYGDSPRFLRKLFSELDQNTRCFWYLWQANRVLNNFSNFVGSLVTIFACVFALQNTSMDAGAVGLSITYALSFTEFVLWVVRLYAAGEMTMNSVERVSEYLELEVEEEDHEKGIEPPAYWPTRDGSVVVEKLTCRYAPQLEPVLQDVSFEIRPREKIGICGRTGSGKSTLALSFFRFLHQSGGKIIIDGIDIAKLSLESLRSRLTILPQEAQLFSGTIRDNLDPFDQHEDAEIWDALRQVGLTGKTPFASRQGSRAASAVDLAAKAQSAKSKAEMKTQAKKLGDDLRTKSLKKLQAEALRPAPPPEEDEEEVVEEKVVIRSLDEKVAVGGKNFSQGQRQLLALARGLVKLRQSNFLIMDESTANLDHATDMTIQNVLRTSLGDTQMLVIAHRLLTVCGLDRILVLDHGRVVEYGTPWELMQKEDGTFRDLVRQSGEETQLFEMASAVHEKRMASSS